MAPRAKKTQPKSKEQILAEMRSNSTFILKMKFIRESFWPALLESTENIEDAQQLLSGFSTAIMQEFLGLMKEKTVADLKLDSKLDMNSPFHVKHVELLSLFKEMSVFEAKEYIEGMKQEISLFLSEEQRKRPLSSLEVKWIDEI